MISVIVYGRNDTHGYNLHRRVALSLNCVAETLTDPDDEIIFVDWNTPDELPTLVDALSDTLTEKCLERLRVLRVRPAIHTKRFAKRTHLSVAEPAARNAAARRANPANRWLLSTNTDMVFVPRAGRSLSEICRDLDDGFYGLPRFELPEWVWEQLPRTDPTRALDEVERLGPGLRLDEPTVSHEWIRFDAPGDFQLVLRDDLVAIDGFNEEMLLGYHVDSNFSRRMLLHRGEILSLGERVAGYHCNHNRTPTVYHGERPISNDLERYFFSVKEPTISKQRESWGLADVELEEVEIERRAATDLAAFMLDAIPKDLPIAQSDAYGDPFALTYDSGHVLPFVADSLVVTTPDASVAYIGANSVLERMLAALVERLGFAPLAAADLEDADAVRSLATNADVVVVDLGLDASLVDPSFITDYTDQSLEYRRKLDRTFLGLHRLIELERKRVRRGAYPRRIVLVNSTCAFWNGYVVAQLDSSYTTIHSRVRRATVKREPDSTELPALLARPTTPKVVLTPLEGAVVISEWEAAVIDVYRRRFAFRAVVNAMIRLGALMTRAARMNRPPLDHDAAGAPVLVAAPEDATALRPMEGAVIDVYRRRPAFRAIVNWLLRVGGTLTRAARLGRPRAA